MVSELRNSAKRVPVGHNESLNTILDPDLKKSGLQLVLLLLFFN